MRRRNDFTNIDFAKVEQQVSGMTDEDSQKVADWINEADTPKERHRRKGDAFAYMYGRRNVEIEELLA